jgi:hypothetical protein
MTFKTVALAHIAGVLGVIDPDAYAAGTVTTGWISAKNYQSFLAVVLAGDLGASATLDAKIQQASDSSGTGVKDLTGAAITQLTQAGTDSNKQALISFGSGDLDIENGFTHFRLSMTVATATSDAGALVLGSDPRFGPATEDDAATVDEVVII